MNNKLIIIGASYLQLPLIEKAKSMGIETHVFAWEEGAVGKPVADFFYPISIIEKEKILDKARHIRPQGIISIASDLAMTTVNFVAEALGLIGNPLDVSERTTNKFLMRKRLHDSGLPCPAFLMLNGPRDAILPPSWRFPVIVKPTDRSGSRGVTKVETFCELGGAIDRAFDESLKKEVIIEEFVHGREVSVEMLSWNGEHHFLAITDKVTTGAPYFVELEQHQPADVSNELAEKIVFTVKQALSCLGIQNGASHSELILTPEDQIVFVEIGGRMGGDFIGSHLVELSTGYDFLKGVIEVALGDFSCIKKTESSFSGVYFLIPQPGGVTEIKNEADKCKEIIQHEVFIHVGDEVKTIMESGNRSGYYIYKSKKEKFNNTKVIEITM